MPHRAPNWRPKRRPSPRGLVWRSCSGVFNRSRICSIPLIRPANEF